MKYIKNKRFPLGDFDVITIWPFVFYKEDMSEVDINHEEIHGKQQRELLIIPFYIIYLLEGLFKGYDNISFEIEAYANDDDPTYLDRRKRFAMWRKTVK